ncbi:hypothetical protein D187_002425 [Cystobacter fuscus DSM 2262]|uniref:Immunity protein 52 domain-containing protein n=1 Tax=Cystobacter fuscus (strain ATCC 25194 / DSM 2262 / NBRC 100088 / M29) TaxID=1242864 RepID=S9P9B1_CYSF2|nr:hypothetical protein D187_002425 [Cystobacter fuscus DSM 2262]
MGGVPPQALTSDRLTPSNPEHVALAWRIQKRLEERGLFRLMVHPSAMRKTEVSGQS